VFPLLPPLGPRIPPSHTNKIPHTALLESCPSTYRSTLKNELRAVKADAAAGITSTPDTAWELWCAFCRELCQDAHLESTADPIPHLQIFARRYRMGIISPSNTKVRARTVEGALRAVGQTLASLGNRDPRLQPSGKLDIRLHRQLTAYSKADPPPTRVKPIPLPIITHCAAVCRQANSPHAHATADMLLIGFFFLLRPGEYAHTSNPESCPFRLCDVHLMHGVTRLDPFHAAEITLRSATHVALEFTNQKNGVRGELVGLGRSGHPHWCPVVAVIQRVLHLRLHQAAPSTPLYTYYDRNRPHSITTCTLTSQLRHTVSAIGAQWGIGPSDISIRSLRSSGAMALLCAAVDTDKIRLLGRWRSDEMLRYLHVQAFPIVAPLATQMLQHGNFALIPNNPLNSSGLLRGPEELSSH
jgi:hypothetical protein